MDNSVLIERSPVRFLDKTLNGGLKGGEIGVVTSDKGMGKTSVLVQLGLDSLLHNHKIVHISFNQSDDSASTWYSNIFHEISKRTNIKDIQSVKENLLKNRILLNFNQNAISIDHAINTLKALEAGGIKTETLIIDDWNIAKVDGEEFSKLKNYAKETNAAIWCGTSVLTNDLNFMFPKYIEEKIDVVINLDQNFTGSKINVLKVRNDKIPESKLSIDSRSLLIKER